MARQRMLRVEDPRVVGLPPRLPALDQALVDTLRHHLHPVVVRGVVGDVADRRLVESAATPRLVGLRRFSGAPLPLLSLQLRHASWPEYERFDLWLCWLIPSSSSPIGRAAASSVFPSCVLARCRLNKGGGAAIVDWVGTAHDFEEWAVEGPPPGLPPFERCWPESFVLGGDAGMAPAPLVHNAWVAIGRAFAFVALLALSRYPAARFP